jgi:hypothetical protein
MEYKGYHKNVEEVIDKELEAISVKRRKCDSSDGTDNPSNLFGIALSGGGIRSATVNLGVLKILHKCGILHLADYLSSVSGGGYIGGYVHSKLRRAGSAKESYADLFTENDLKHFREYGYYLTPGSGLKEAINKLRFAGVFVFSLLMNWIWVFALFSTLYFMIQGITGIFNGSSWEYFGYLLCLISIITIIIHFFFHGLRHLNLWPYNALYYIEGFIFLFSVFYLAHLVADLRPTLYPWNNFLSALVILIIIGFFANPNVLTMYRFYRDRIAEAYLGDVVQDGDKLKLSELNPGKEAKDWGAAPYPLINTCLNVLGKGDDSFPGAKMSDYFLLSPLYCGSRLTGYTETLGDGYKRMFIPTAVAISGAAVNPEMGIKTNKVLAFFMTLLNLRLGYWAYNPKSKFRTLTWWPYYHVMELLSTTDTKKGRVNISDGGHIENLGIYELLRRRCKLIIAIDATADAGYGFSDLSNLVIRARNELGISVKFRESLKPENVIKPSPSSGFSQSHFAIADIKELSREEREGSYKGLLVYIKSSLKATDKYKMIQSPSFQYKTYHTAFPHESTADQFFDEVQWKAYYNLGRFMAGDLLGIDVTDEERSDFGRCRVQTIDELYSVFDKFGRSQQQF